MAHHGYGITKPHICILGSRKELGRKEGSTTHGQLTPRILAEAPFKVHYTSLARTKLHDNTSEGILGNVVFKQEPLRNKSLLLRRDRRQTAFLFKINFQMWLPSDVWQKEQDRIYTFNTNINLHGSKTLGSFHFLLRAHLQVFVLM